MYVFLINVYVSLLKLKNVIMNANELRVGNYIVGHHESDCDCETEECNECMTTSLCKVVALDNVGMTDHSIWIESKETDVEFFESFEGIPLTEKWLIDFGFEFSDFDFYILNVTNKFKVYISISIVDNSYQLCQNGNGYSVDIKNIHQLQNLYFALTGEELIKK